jgi:hypothetical protein
MKRSGSNLELKAFDLGGTGAVAIHDSNIYNKPNFALKSIFYSFKDKLEEN